MDKQKGKKTRLPDRLIETAAQLFAQNGYEGTTVQQVIDSVGASKGAFYHHFSSKEDLLDAVAEGMTQEGAAAFRGILENPDATALEKLTLYLTQRRRWRLRQMNLLGAMIRVLYKDENAIIRRKIDRRTIEALTPLLTELVAQGVEEGVFHTPDPSEAALLLLQLGNVYSEAVLPQMIAAKNNPELIEPIERRIKFYLDVYERLLGLEPGTLPQMDKEQIKLIIDLLQPSEVTDAAF